MSEHLYVVVYDIADPKRWRRVFRLLHGFGEWMQLSVFQCALAPVRRERMLGRLEALIEPGEDHVICLDLGPADGIRLQVTSLGKPYRPIETGPKVL